MTKILCWFTLIVAFVSLVAWQKNASQEVIQYEPRSDVYTHFASDPQSVKEELIKNYGQGIEQLLQGILLSQEKPSDATIHAFSKLIAEVYQNATNSNLSQSENKTHAETLGMILGGLGGLRNEVIAKRKVRFFNWWYDYTELDKRWLALFTDIFFMDLSHESHMKFISTSSTSNVNEVAESLTKINHIKQKKGDDLVGEAIDKIVESVIADFNGYKEKTGRNIRTVFNGARTAAWSDMKYQINKKSN